MLSPCAWLTSFLLPLLLHFAQRMRGRVTSGHQFLLWLLSLLCQSVTLRSQIIFAGSVWRPDQLATGAAKWTLTAGLWLMLFRADEPAEGYQRLQDGDGGGKDRLSMHCLPRAFSSFKVTLATTEIWKCIFLFTRKKCGGKKSKRNAVFRGKQGSFWSQKRHLREG